MSRKKGLIFILGFWLICSLVMSNSENPKMVYDINLCTDIGSSPELMTVYRDKLCFRADDGIHGVEFWIWDGSNVPQLFDLYPGVKGSKPNHLFVFKDKLYFQANTGEFGYELYVFDETGPPQLAYDINPSGSSYPADFVEYKDSLYFGAYHPDYGRELWRFDGINQPELVADILPGSSGSNPIYMTVFQNQIFFQAYIIGAGYEMVAYDGENDPILVADTKEGSSSGYPGLFIEFNGKLIFRAEDGVHGRELWIYDGVNPPEMIMDINPNSLGSYPENFIIYNNKLYFGAEQGGVGIELWVYDGTECSIVKDFYSSGGSLAPKDFCVYNNILYFNGRTSYGLEDLFKYEGSGSPGMVMVDSHNIGGYPSDLVVYQDELLFTTAFHNHGRELIRYDGTSVSMAADLYKGQSEDADLEFLTGINDKLVFYADDGINGKQMYVYDGLNSPVKMSNFNGSLSDFVEVNQKLYFTHKEDSYDLWEYDGENLNLFYPGFRYAGELISFKDKLIFTWADAESGFELWEYDLINEPYMTFDIDVEGSSYPKYFCESEGNLIFQAKRGDTEKLFIYDGYNAPVEIDTGAHNGSVTEIIGFDGKIYFDGYDSSHRRELWVYDGFNPAVMVYDINPTGDSNPKNLNVCNGKLYFNANDGVNGKEVWEYDGINPPKMIDLSTGSSADPFFFIEYNERVYFEAFHENYQRELFVYDGINPPAVLADINPAHPNGYACFYNSYPTVWDGKLYFAASDGLYGQELWVYYEAPRENLIGSWAGLGIWEHNSPDGSWTRLDPKPAIQLTSGNVVGDPKEDLIGWWDIGIFFRDGSDGSWTKINDANSQALVWITAGDFNGDGVDDFMGSWNDDNTKGVFWRDSISGSWTKFHNEPASMIAAGDFDADGIDDVMGVWEIGLWVWYSKTNKWENVKHSNFEIMNFLTCGDLNGDGKSDLLGSWSSQNISGIYWRDSATKSWTKLNDLPADCLATGDLDGDGLADILGSFPGYGVWSTTGPTKTWQKITNTEAISVTAVKK